MVKLTLSKSSAFVQTNADSSQGKLSSLQKLCLDTPVNEVSLSEWTEFHIFKSNDSKGGAQIGVLILTAVGWIFSSAFVKVLMCVLEKHVGVALGVV